MWYTGKAKLAKKVGERRVLHHASRLGGKDKTAPVAKLPGAPQHGNGLWSERYAVLLFPLHAFCRDGPQNVLKVDLVPNRAPNLA